MNGIRPISKLTRFCLLSLLFGSSASYAGGFQLYEQSVSSMGNAYAGTAAVAQDATTSFYNPAGMTLLNSIEMDGSVILLNLDSVAHVKESTSNSLVGLPFGLPPVDVLGKDRQQIGTWSYIPAVNVVLPQCHRFAFGMSVTAPFGLTTAYDGDSKIKYLATWSKVTTIDVSPTVALQVTPQFSIGGGLDVQYIKADLYQKVPVGETLPPIPFGGPYADGEFTNRATDKHGLGWNVGALYQFNCGHTRLGASYRSRVHHNLEGYADLTLPPPLTSSNGFVKSTVTLPDYANLSLYHDFNCKWAAMGSIGWTNWSIIDTVTLNYTGPITDAIETVDLALAFKDAWRYALGVNYQLNCRWKLRAGLAYDETPVRNAQTRTYRLPDSDRIVAGLGVQYKLSQCLLVDLGYNCLMPRDCTTDQTTSNTLANGGVLTAHAISDFDSVVNSVGLQVSWRVM